MAAALSEGGCDVAVDFTAPDAVEENVTLAAIGEDGHEIPDTAIVIDAQLPVLFGYQPYHPGVGYLLYEGDTTPDGEIYMHN